MLRGMSTRDIQGHLEEMYAFEVSPSLISEGTEAVMQKVRAWQSMALNPVYPIVYLDALIVKMWQEGPVENRAASGRWARTWKATKRCLTYGPAPSKEPSSGYRFRPPGLLEESLPLRAVSLLTELRNCGVQDILIACVHDSKDFSMLFRPCIRRRKCSYASCIWCATV